MARGRPMRGYQPDDETFITGGIRLLKEARHLFRLANCPQAAKATQRAVSSADGALRHLENRRRHAQEAT